MIMSKFSHRDVVLETNVPNKEYVVLGNRWEEGILRNKNSILALDGDNNTVVSLNECDIYKIEEFNEIDVYFCPPIFDDLLLSNKVMLKTSNAKGAIIAINPMIIPLTDQCHYLLRMEDGSFQEFSRSEIELDI